jgi:hypothetical protein
MSMKWTTVGALVLCGILGSGSKSEAAPVMLPGTVLNFGNPDYFAIAAVLGYVPPPGDNTIYSLVAFDLGSLSFDPTAALLVDDNVPLGSDPSSLAGSGLDIDAAGGLTLGGTPNYATGVHAYVPGERISPSPGAVAAGLLEAYTLTLPPGARSVAAPGGTGGPGFLFGVGADALGAPDGRLSVIESPPGSGIFVLDPSRLPEGYVSIGSGGQLSLLFASAINRNGNIGGTIWDFVYWDTGGAGDNGFLLFDDQAIAPIPEPGTMLLFGSGLVFAAVRLRRSRASQRAR